MSGEAPLKSPFKMTTRRTNGIVVTIAEEPAGLVTTVFNGQRAWSGVQPDIEAAIALARRIVEAQTFTVVLPPIIEIRNSGDA